MLTGPPVFRVNGIVRETLISASGAALPSNVVIRWSELRWHAQAMQNDYIVPIDTKAWGRVWTGGPPWQFSATPGKWFSTPGIGEHNDEIIAEVQELRAAAARSNTPTPTERA